MIDRIDAAVACVVGMVFFIFCLALYLTRGGRPVTLTVRGFGMEMHFERKSEITGHGNADKPVVKE